MTFKNKTKTLTVHHKICVIGVADEEETVLKYERYNKYTSNPLYGALVRVFLVLDVPIILLLTLYTPAPGQAVVTGVVISPPRFLPLIFIAHRAQQSHCSSIFHGVLLTHALALSASQFVHKKKSHEFIRGCTRRGSNSRN